MAPPRLRGGWRGLLHALGILGALLTAAPAWFLMQYPFAAVMAVAFLGFLFGPILSDRRTA